MKRANMNNLLPETLLPASEMEVESDLAELQAGLHLVKFKGGVEDLHQELVEVSNQTIYTPQFTASLTMVVVGQIMLEN